MTRRGLLEATGLKKCKRMLGGIIGRRMIVSDGPLSFRGEAEGKQDSVGIGRITREAEKSA